MVTLSDYMTTYIPREFILLRYLTYLTVFTTGRHCT